MLGKLTSKIIKDSQLPLLAYKLLHDVLFLLVLSFVAALFAEAVLPGLVSHNNGFMIISFALFATIFSIVKIKGKTGVSFKGDAKHHIFPLVLIGSFILIGNSLLKFSLSQNILITGVTLIFFSLLYQLIFLEKHNRKNSSSQK